MTSVIITPPPHQESNPSYPVTWEELRNIYVGGLSLDKYDEIILRKTCSRPHPPAPSELAATSPCVQCLEEDRVSMMEHDAAIAAQAREDEINRIISILEGYRFGLDYPDCPPGDTIKSLVESLRSSSEVQE